MATVTKSFTWNVLSGPDILNPDVIPDLILGTPYIYELSIFDPFSEGTVTTSLNLPTGLTLENPDSLTPTITGMIAGFPPTTYFFSLTVNCNGRDCSATKVFTMSSVCTAPVITTNATLPDVTLGILYTLPISLTVPFAETTTLLDINLPDWLQIINAKTTTPSLKGLVTCIEPTFYTFDLRLVSDVTGCYSTKTFHLNVLAPQATVVHKVTLDGFITDALGRFIPGVRVFIRIKNDPTDKSNISYLRKTITYITDDQGYFSVCLPANKHIDVSVPSCNIQKSGVLPFSGKISLNELGTY